MKTSIINYFRKNWISLAIIAGLGVYIIVSGVTRSCPACAFVTDSMGITP